MNIHHPPDYSSVPQDNAILEHYGINELNFESIKKYREKFSALKPNHPWNGLEMKEKRKERRLLLVIACGLASLIGLVRLVMMQLQRS